jgi:hypothetical protein
VRAPCCTLSSRPANAVAHSLRSGIKSLSKGVKHGCYELVCVPQIQTYLECRFSGFSSRSELEESKSFNIVGKVKGYLHMLGIMFLLPVLGLYPPLAEHKKLKFTPRLRYYLFELQSVGLFVIMSCTHLNIYRDEPLAIRDCTPACAGPCPCLGPSSVTRSTCLLGGRPHYWQPCLRCPSPASAFRLCVALC